MSQPSSNPTRRKTVTLILISVLLATSLAAQSGQLATVRKHLQRIEQAYDTQVAYATTTLPDTSVRFELNGPTAKDDLSRLLRPFNLGVDEIGNQYIVVARIERLLSVTGFVIDRNSEERLVGATVYAISAGRGVSTNGYGYFSITGLLPEDRLVMRYVGYSVDTLTVRKLQTKPAILSLSPNLELQAVEILATANQQADLPNVGRALAPSLLSQTQLLNGREDVNSWLSLQPGVASAAGGYRGYAIRGADPEHNLTILDDATLYLPSHAVGYFSVVPGDAIRSWRLHPDAGPARYGDRVGGVVDMRLREGNRQRRGGNINLGLSDIGLTFEGPVGKGSFFTSARRGLTDFWLRALRPAAQASSSARPDLDFTFYDVALKINHPLGRRQQLLGSVFLGRDDYGDEARVFSADVNTSYAFRDRSDRSWANLVGSLRHTYLLNDRWFMNTTLTLSDFRYVAEDYYELTTSPLAQPDSGRVASALNVFDSRIQDLGFKADVQYTLSRTAVARIGVDAVSHSFRIINSAAQNSEGGATPAPDPPLSGVRTLDLSNYIELDLTPLPDWSINAGLRVATQLSRERGYTAPLPRLHISYTPAPDWRLDLGATMARQYIHQIGTNNPGLPRDLWIPTVRGLRPLQSEQTSGSVTYSLTKATTLSGGAFGTRLRGLARLSNDFAGSDYDDWVSNVRLGKGAAYGLWVQGHTDFVRWTLDWSYNFGKNWRRFENGFGDLGTPERARLDRRHFTAITAEYRPTKPWAISATGRFGSGLPARVPQRVDSFEGPVPETNLPLTNPWNYEGRQRNLPNYYVVDLGARFSYERESMARKVTFGLQNITLRRNPLFINLRRVQSPVQGQGLYENTFVFAPPFIPFVRYSLSF